jgi:hypothetical protein
LFTTSITLAEILYGIARLPDGRRKVAFAVPGLGTARCSAVVTVPNEVDATVPWGPFHGIEAGEVSPDEDA